MIVNKTRRELHAIGWSANGQQVITVETGSDTPIAEELEASKQRNPNQLLDIVGDPRGGIQILEQPNRRIAVDSRRSKTEL